MYHLSCEIKDDYYLGTWWLDHKKMFMIDNSFIIINLSNYN